MAILQALFAILFRSLGKILNTAFGWATVALFGKVPQDRQVWLSVSALGSVVWIVVVLGIAFPSFATFLLAFVTLPRWVEPSWVRVAMLAAALFVPLGVGFASTRILAPDARPHGARHLVRALLKGYPYTIGLATTILLMLVFAPYLKLVQLARRRRTTHIPIIVEPGDYLEVLHDIEDALARGGIATERALPSWMLRLPTRMLRFFAGRSMDRLVVGELATLVSPFVEATLHPSDLIITGEAHEVARAQAVLAARLTLTKAYLTWTKEANEIEDRIRRAWLEVRGGAGSLARARDGLLAVEEDLRRAQLAYEEWEILFREKLQVEVSLLEARARARKAA